MNCYLNVLNHETTSRLPPCCFLGANAGASRCRVLKTLEDQCQRQLSLHWLIKCLCQIDVYLLHIYGYFLDFLVQ